MGKRYEIGQGRHQLLEWEMAMEIYIGSITDARNRVKQQDAPVPPDKPKRERRKERRDRRRSVREGIIVTLSIKNDRRSGRDRRRNTP